MKRYILSLLVAIATSIPTFGMSLRDAQAQAYFLSDKMAYELNLTPQQYDQVYQVNLEYFLSVNSPSDLDGIWWRYRNTDLSYILYDWQWRLYRAADYFIRPLSWVRGAWYCSLWDRYHRDYFFYHRPTVYVHCHGGLWHGRHHNTPSPFIGHRPPDHHGGMNVSWGKPGKPGHQGYHPDNHGRPGGNNGYKPGNGGNRPGGNNGYNPGNSHNNRPGGNNGYNPGNNHNNRPGGNNGYNPGNSHNNRPSGNNGYNPGNNNRPIGGRGGNSMSNSRSGRSTQSATSNGGRSFNNSRTR